MSPPALTELLRGKGSHVDPIACVEDLPPELAARTVKGFPHSIGQLVFHMNYWMDYELRRIRGERPKYPEHNSETFPPASSRADTREWDRLRKQMGVLLDELSALARSPQPELDRPMDVMDVAHTKIAGTLEAVLWQTVAHNSYHAGQIALIRRALGAWPPSAGGDTW